MTHQTISFIKSGMRIGGYFILAIGIVTGSLITILGLALLIVAEILGVIEELV